MKSIIAAVLLSLGASFAHAQGAQPLKIVGSLDLSGPLSALGAEALLGYQIAIEEFNKKGGVLGRQLVLEHQDNGSNPQRALAQATALALQNPALLMSPIGSGSTLAVTKAVSLKNKLPMCITASASEEVTMRDFQPYMFSLPGNAYGWLQAITARLAKQPHKRYAIIMPDYVAGRTIAARFKDFMKQFNPAAEIVVEEYPKLGTIDFTTTINKVLAAKPDYVWTQLVGGDLVTFMKQGNALGFFKQLDNRFLAPMVSNELKIAGSEAAPVGVEGYQYAPFNYLASKFPLAKEFVALYRAKTGNYPSDIALMGYDCVNVWAQAVTAAKSIEADAVIRAIENTEFTTMRGPARFRKIDHLIEVPLYVGKVVDSKDHGQPVLAIQEEIPASLQRPTDAAFEQSRKP